MAVSTNDIAIALGREAPEFDSPEEKQWQMWIDDAMLLVRARLGEPDLLNQQNLDYVVREAVAAQVRRPDDATSVEVAVDDGRVAKRYSSSRGRVFIRDEWWKLLDPSGRSGAFTLDLAPSRVEVHSETCSLRFGATFCSCGASIAGFPIYGPRP